MSDLTRRQLLGAAAGGALVACTPGGGNMSITVRPAGARGASRLSWLDSRHTFSFSDYFDPAHMGFRALRVINEDKVAPGQGFATHGHRDMEILSWVLDGELSHKDSMGNGSIIRPGELQRMSAGTGVLHSEFNPSGENPVHFLQIWILPDRRGHTPGYEQRSFPVTDRAGALRLIASPDGRDGSVSLHQDVTLWAADLAGGSLSHTLAPGRGAWVQVTRGDVTVGGKKLQAGDGAAIEGEGAVSLSGSGEVLLFDLA